MLITNENGLSKLYCCLRKRFEEHTNKRDADKKVGEIINRLENERDLVTVWKNIIPEYPIFAPADINKIAVYFILDDENMIITTNTEKSCNHIMSLLEESG